MGETGFDRFLQFSRKSVGFWTFFNPCPRHVYFLQPFLGTRHFQAQSFQNTHTQRDRDTDGVKISKTKNLSTHTQRDRDTDEVKISKTKAAVRKITMDLVRNLKLHSTTSTFFCSKRKKTPNILPRSTTSHPVAACHCCHTLRHAKYEEKKFLLLLSCAPVAAPSTCRTPRH
jgi:hypothetical protein